MGCAISLPKERAYMSFPTEKQLKLIKPKAEKTEPIFTLPKYASRTDRLKYKICEKFVIHFRENNIVTTDFSRKLKIDPSRINGILKYQISHYTVDGLLDLAELINLDFKITIS